MDRVAFTGLDYGKQQSSIKAVSARMSVLQSVVPYLACTPEIYL